MELVKGIPITKYCDEHHLTPRQRLELFIPVCHAVQHAHQKGIIHRDLKPSNVLVAQYDGRPVPKVIDFGVAKAAGQPLTEQTLVTGFGAIVGTLEYMSPEQAELNQLDIDTRSDIYSLGVLLYELLTGSTPFSKKELEKAGMLEMLRVIREQEPSKPSTKLSTAEGLPTLAANRGTEPAKLTKLVRGELDWIVMKALEKDRNRRYETANGFAIDVQRYLADEPVLACPPSVGYRVRKFVRRNKSGMAVAALVLFFLVLLGSGAGWAVRDRAAHVAEVARERADRQTKVAAQVELILADVDRLMQEQKWDAALAVVKRAEAAVTGGEAEAETAQRVRALVNDLEFIDRLEQIRMQRATIVEGKFDHARAVHEYTRAFRDYGVDVEELAVETSIDRLKARPALAIPLAAALDDWVYVRRQVPETNAADWRKLVAVARGIDPEPMRDRLRSTWGQPISDIEDDLRRLAESINVQMQHPATLVILARSLQRGKLTDHALRILCDAQHGCPGDFWLNFECGDALLKKKNYEGAIRFYTAAVAIRPNSPAALNNLGFALDCQKKPVREEAMRCFRKAIELQPKFARPYENLSRALARQDKFDDAVALLLKAMELYSDHAGSLDTSAWTLNQIAWMLATHPDPARRDRNRAVTLAKEAVERIPHSHMAWQYLGWIYYRTGDWKSSIEALEKSCQLQPNKGDAGQWIVFALAHAQLSSQADLSKEQREHHNSEARRWYDAADEQIESWWRARPDEDPGQGIWDFRAEARELMGPSDSSQAAALLEQAQSLRNQKKYAEAETALREAIRLRPTLLVAHARLGWVLQLQGKFPEMETAFRELLRIKPDNAVGHHGLGKALLGQKKAIEGIASLREAVRLGSKDHWVHNALGWALVEQAKPAEAEIAFREVIRLKPEMAHGYFGLGRALVDQKKFADAESAARDALRIEPKHPWAGELLRQALDGQGKSAEPDDPEKESGRKNGKEKKPE
jgi:tetratricopeptide (TPR) repeat protein